MAKATKIEKPTTPASTTNGTPIVKAVFSSDLPHRVALMTFLEASYEGGCEYKYATDAHGEPVLTPHESEAGFALQRTPTTTGQNTTNTPPVTPVDRYARRQSVAVYENHFGPIVEKIAAYLMRTPPKRNEQHQDEHKRLKLSIHIGCTVEEGLKLTESWIGWDSVNIPLDAAATEAQAAQLDPANRGKPYLVTRDPRCVVDSEVDERGNVVRVVFREDVEEKSSLTADAKKYTNYREWTATEWVLYQAVAKDDKSGQTTPHYVANSGETSQTVQEIDRGTHAFGRCPWVRFKPKFRTVDLAEINRLLFNVGSLLDEELYKNTFTQKYILGARVEDVTRFGHGAGNMWVIPNQDATVDVLGAIEGQAVSLTNRMEHLRDAMYRIVSLEGSETKNSPEAAQKKRLDMDSLYATLVKITEEIERVENALLIGLELADDEDPATLSGYSRVFDIVSFSELLDDLERLRKQPHMPAEIKRRLTAAAVMKYDPHGDQLEVADEVDEVIDCTPDTADALATLKNANMLTADMAIEVLGVPEDQEEAFREKFDSHQASPFDLGAGIGPDGLPIRSTNQEGATDVQDVQDGGEQDNGDSGANGASGSGGFGGIGTAGDTENGAGTAGPQNRHPQGKAARPRFGR